MSSNKDVTAKRSKKKRKVKDRLNKLNMSEKYRSKESSGDFIKKIEDITNPEEKEKFLRAYERLGLEYDSTSDIEVNLQLGVLTTPDELDQEIQNKLKSTGHIIDEKGDYLKPYSRETTIIKDDSISVTSKISQNYLKEFTSKTFQDHLEKVSSKTSSKFKDDSTISIPSKVFQDHLENVSSKTSLKFNDDSTISISSKIFQDHSEKVSSKTSSKLKDDSTISMTSKISKEHLEKVSSKTSSKFNDDVMSISSKFNDGLSRNDVIQEEDRNDVVSVKDTDENKNKAKNIKPDPKIVVENFKEIANITDTNEFMKEHTNVMRYVQKFKEIILDEIGQNEKLEKVKKKKEIFKKSKSDENLSKPADSSQSKTEITTKESINKVKDDTKSRSKPKTSIGPVSSSRKANEEQSSKVTASKQVDFKQSSTKIPTLSNQKNSIITSPKPTSTFKRDSQLVPINKAGSLLNNVKKVPSRTSSEVNDYLKNSTSKPPTPFKGNSKQFPVPVQNNVKKVPSKTSSKVYDHINNSTSKPSTPFRGDSKQFDVPVQNNVKKVPSKTSSEDYDNIKNSTSKPSTPFKGDKKQVPVPVQNNVKKVPSKTSSEIYDQIKNSTSKPSTPFKGDKKQVPVPVQKFPSKTSSKVYDHIKSSTSKPSTPSKGDTKQLPVNNNVPVQNNGQKVPSKTSFKVQDRIKNSTSKPPTPFEGNLQQVPVDTSVPVQNNTQKVPSKPSTPLKVDSQDVPMTTLIDDDVDRFSSKTTVINKPLTSQKTHPPSPYSLTKLPTKSKAKKPPSSKVSKVLENEIKIVSKSSTYQNGSQQFSYSIQSAYAYDDSQQHPSSYLIKSKTFTSITSSNQGDTREVTRITENFDNTKKDIKSFDKKPFDMTSSEQCSDDQSTNSSARRALELKRRFNAAITTSGDGSNEDIFVMDEKKSQSHGRCSPQKTVSSGKSTATVKSNRSLYELDYEPIEESKVDEEFELNEILLDQLLVESTEMATKVDQGLSMTDNNKTGFNISVDQVDYNKYDIPEFESTQSSKKWTCSIMTPMTKQFKRKNFTFSDIEVKNIECENRHLESRIKKLMRKPSGVSNNRTGKNYFFEASSSINRKKLDAKTCYENLKIERRLKEIKKKSNINAPWALPVWI